MQSDIIAAEDLFLLSAADKNSFNEVSTLYSPLLSSTGVIIIDTDSPTEPISALVSYSYVLSATLSSYFRVLFVSVSFSMTFISDIQAGTFLQSVYFLFSCCIKNTQTTTHNKTTQNNTSNIAHILCFTMSFTLYSMPNTTYPPDFNSLTFKLCLFSVAYSPLSYDHLHSFSMLPMPDPMIFHQLPLDLLEPI